MKDKVEKITELEKKIYKLRIEVTQLAMMEEEAQKYALKMKQENKKLREALEKIKSSTHDSEAFQIAEKSLEE